MVVMHWVTRERCCEKKELAGVGLQDKKKEAEKLQKWNTFKQEVAQIVL